VGVGNVRGCLTESLAEACAASTTAGVTPQRDAQLGATGVWAVVHCVTPSLVARPGGPCADVDLLRHHLVALRCRG